MNIKQFHMKLLWAIIHPELFLLPYGKKKPVKMKKIYLTIQPCYYNRFDLDTQQFQDITTSMSGHFIILDSGGNVLYNSLTRSLNPTSYYSNISLDVPDLSEEYDFTIKIKVIAGYDVDDIFYDYTLQIKPKITSYSLKIGHNLSSHFYTIHKTRHDARIPLGTVKVGDTGSVDITGFQLDRCKLAVHLHSSTEIVEVYKNENWDIDGSNSYYTVINILRDNRVAGYAFTINKNIKYANVSGRRQSEYVFFDQTVRYVYGTIPEDEWDGQLTIEYKNGFDLSTGKYSTNYLRSSNVRDQDEYPAQSNARIEANGQSIPTTITRSLPVSNPKIEGNEDISQYAVNYVTAQFTLGGQISGFQISTSPLEWFDPSNINNLVDYWTVVSGCTIGNKYKTTEFNEFMKLNAEGKAYSLGSPSLYLQRGNSVIKSLTANGNYVEINTDDETLTYVGPFGYRVSDDYEYWLEQAGR